MDSVLLLNADYTPLSVLGWQRAVNLLLDEKANVVVEYAGRVIRSQSFDLPWPAVVALHRYRKHSERVRFNRISVIARDSASCQYCGVTPRGRNGRLAIDELTLDHVVPRARAVDGRVRLPWSGRRVPVTSWENVVIACEPCNHRKADRLPEEAGMTLRRPPHRPSSREILHANLLRARIPEEWRMFLPEATLPQS
ncbi:MAG: HNH endonuclease [Alphaproteobacteria bacterium]|nr:HNH endonuclease [Alphaproteobacteria bacterium]